MFFGLLVFLILRAIAYYLLVPRAFMAGAKAWARSSVWLMRVICNTKVEYRGLEKIPKGPLIVASKHQSMWETFALLQFFDAPLFIYKRELGWIPFFGWYLMKSKMIGVDRDGGVRSLMQMARRAPKEIRSGRQLIIFPEGTRRPVGAPPDYMTGVGQIYVNSGVPCIPVALNSGLFWPRRTFIPYPAPPLLEGPSPPGHKIEKRPLLRWRTESPRRMGPCVRRDDSLKRQAKNSICDSPPRRGGQSHRCSGVSSCNSAAS